MIGDDPFDRSLGYNLSLYYIFLLSAALNNNNFEVRLCSAHWNAIWVFGIISRIIAVFTDIVKFNRFWAWLFCVNPSNCAMLPHQTGYYGESECHGSQWHSRFAPISCCIKPVSFLSPAKQPELGSHFVHTRLFQVDIILLKLTNYHGIHSFWEKIICFDSIMSIPATKVAHLKLFRAILRWITPIR